MSLKNFRCALFGAFILFIVSCTVEDSDAVTTNNTPIVSTFNYSSLELETMSLINSHRLSIGLNALETIDHVSYISEDHDEYMIENNVVNHNNFEARSSSIIQTLGAKNVSENIAYNYNSAQGVFDAWLKSDGHKKNMEGDFTHFGIAVRENPVTNKKYYTNIFVKI
ncbi:CAP domain-containing protein [Flavobacterium adhaerens]|uniref:CAP domain-containing protein n=1 Tax=Flavobacterium adhaerens TaxID=3149043 RepID=UPI0032B4E3ED